MRPPDAKIARGVDEPTDGGKKIYYPETIRFDSRQLPQIKKWEIGEIYTITLKVKMTDYSLRKSGNGKEKETAVFEVVAVKADSSLTEEQKRIKDVMTKYQNES